MQRYGLVRHLGVGAVVAFLALPGCGGDDNGGTVTPDARPAADAAGGAADARPADAAPALTPTHSGTVSVQDVSVFGAPQLGHGGQINISFTKTGVPSSMSAGSCSAIPPCCATLTDVTNTAMANPGVDEGAVTIAVSPGTRNIPACTFVGTSYRCVSGMGTAAATAAVSAPVYSFMGTGAGTAVAGHYVLGAGGAGAGMAMPIVVAQSGTNLTVVSSTAPPNPFGAWLTAAGIGPVPPVPGVAPTPPEFLADDDSVQVTLAGGTDFSARMNAEPFAAGNAFELSDATAAMFGNTSGIDLDAALSVGCKQTGTSCTEAVGTIVSIDTTDGPAGTGTDFNPATHFSGNITCAAFGDGPVMIPATHTAVLKAGSPTKLRIATFRVGFAPLNGTAGAADPKMRNSVNVVAGHGIVHFQTGGF
jgi:hypothetical protein